MVEDKFQNWPKLPTVNYEAVGKYLCAIRESNKFSVKELEAILTRIVKQVDMPITPNYIIALEDGRIAPHFEHLRSLEEALGLKSNELHHAYGYLAANEVPPHGEEYIGLADAADLVGICKTTLHAAVRRREISFRRLMPPPGRASLILKLKKTDVESYSQRKKSKYRNRKK